MSGIIKHLALKVLRRTGVSSKDLTGMGVQPDYPDLVNMLVKSEGVVFFSEVCSDYLEEPSFNTVVQIISLKHILHSYLFERSSDYTGFTRAMVSHLMEGTRKIHGLNLKNKVMRDNEYRKLIKDCIPTINSNDASYLIALLQQIANKS